MPMVQHNNIKSRVTTANHNNSICAAVNIIVFLYISVPHTLARGPNLARGPHLTGPRGHAFSINFPVN